MGQDNEDALEASPRTASSILHSTPTTVDRYLYENFENHYRGAEKGPMPQLSLPLHILSRLAEVEQRVSDTTGDQILDDESVVLLELSQARRQLRNWAATNPQAEENQNLLGKFNPCWLATLKHFVQHARMILTTAGMASSRHVRVLPAEHIILDEVSQMKEYETVNAMA